MKTEEELMRLRQALANEERQIAKVIRNLRLSPANLVGKTIRVVDSAQPVVFVTTDNRFFAIDSSRYDEHTMDLDPDVDWQILYKLGVLCASDVQHVRKVSEDNKATQERLQYETQIAALIRKAKKSPELLEQLQALLANDSDQSQSD